MTDTMISMLRENVFFWKNRAELLEEQLLWFIHNCSPVGGGTLYYICGECPDGYDYDKTVTHHPDCEYVKRLRDIYTNIIKEENDEDS